VGAVEDRNFGLPIDLAHRLYNSLLLSHKPWSRTKCPVADLCKFIYVSSFVICNFAAVAECVIELDVSGVKSLSPAANSSEVKDHAEMCICSAYQLTSNPFPTPDIQLIAFKKFNKRFSAFVMIGSREALGKLVECYFCGELKRVLEQPAKSIIDGVRIKRIDWSVKDYASCNEYFLDRIKPLHSSNASTPTSSLPQTSPSFAFSNLRMGT